MGSRCLLVCRPGFFFPCNIVLRRQRQERRRRRRCFRSKQQPLVQPRQQLFSVRSHLPTLGFTLVVHLCLLTRTCRCCNNICRTHVVLSRFQPDMLPMGRSPGRRSFFASRRSQRVFPAPRAHLVPMDRPRHRLPDGRRRHVRHVRCWQRQCHAQHATGPEPRHAHVPGQERRHAPRGIGHHRRLHGGQCTLQ